ncbi:hypothetical protein M1P56_23850 [Streptomyces sp. HU2014]|uniref:hypothetical protein n=1 Tax=Streptomyces sp. HU2014 TaxID=2939414 RepID=UPI00200C18FB|nr:hypothetical protein [Streptomyces sp. HU2014]UQI47161.1 hypothetical protein M1P56_23850 [Streptomyces sp. HU2014]
MDLLARVRRALSEQAIHPTEFERCACALLQSQYPGLSAVEGGHDFGRDADIYFPWGPDDVDARGRLLVTTGDPVANMRRGLRRMHEENVSADLIVMACSQPVDATQIAAMDRLCTEHGLLAPHIYPQAWFIPRLATEPAWRLSLLGIRGELGALLDRPLDLQEDLADRTEFLGRGVALATLTEALTHGRDVVLVGVPGVGKTRLTTELEGQVTYLEQAQANRVLDELLEKRPAAVVVDDAHMRLDEMRVLRRARHETEHPFTIVATTWPDRADEVLAAIPRALRLDVDLLERSDMNALVTSLGVTGHRARQAVLDQAAGRPGWALALCDTLTNGEGKQVASGAAHLANAERHLRRITESETAVDALACVAALGGTSAEALHALAPLVGEPPARMSGLMERLARNGLVEAVNGVWHLQPALRAPLIAKRFFTPPARRPWSTLWDAFPDRARDLVSAAISATQVSASPDARMVADTWIRTLPPPNEWDTGIFAVVSEYARLDLRAARFAVAAARAVLANPRETQQMHGTTVDLLGDAAARQLAQSAAQYLLPEAIAGLLDLAVGDDRPRHSTPQHPLQVLSDVANAIDPDFGATFDVRELLLKSVLEWLSTHRTPLGWAVATDVLASVFAIETSGNWTDPGALNTVTLAQGVESTENLARLISLWDQVMPELADPADQDGLGSAPAAIVPLLDLAGSWVRLGEGFVSHNGEPGEGQKAQGAVGGARILATLYPLLQAFPGLALRTRRMLDAAYARSGDMRDGLPVLDVDPDLDSFASWSRWDGTGFSEETLQGRALAVEALARKIAALGPLDGTAKFDALIEQAELAGDHGGGVWVSDRLVPHLADPAAWYAAATRAGSPLMARAALTQWFTISPDTVSADVLSAALDDPRFRTGVISTILQRGEDDEAAEFVIGAMQTEDAWLLDSLFIQGEPNMGLHLLLLHPVPEISGSAAIVFAIGQPHGPALPESWRSAWRNAVQHLRPRDLSHHVHWRVGQLLSHLVDHDPDLLETWYAERIDEMADCGYFMAPEPHGCNLHLDRLPQEHRYRLAVRCAGMPRVGHSPLIQLIGADRDLAERLLRDRTVTPDNLLDALLGQRNETLERLGPLLLSHGVPPSRIAANVAWVDSWWGEDSARHHHLIDYFTDLTTRVPALASIATAGLAQQQELPREAEVKERAARVRGQ